MFANEDYRILAGIESHTTYGTFGVRVMIAASQMPSLEDDVIQSVGDKAVRGVFAELAAAAVAVNLDAKTRRTTERGKLLELFDEPIYVEEIPNGYCSDWCCRHLPWFIVTTRIGRFKIGWRKKVISIDWSDSLATKTANEVFPDENVTKDGRLIHAWSYDDGRRYIQSVIASVQTEDAS